MQVNGSQDYLSQYKRSVIAKSIAVASPPQQRRTTQMYTSVKGNGQDQYNKFVSAPGRNNYYGAPLGTTYNSLCCNPNNVLVGGAISYTPAYPGIQSYLV